MTPARSPVAAQPRANRQAGAVALQAALVAAVFLLNLYRAVHQSITYDEAWTYLHYASRPWGKVLGTFEANHHVLHTYLVKAACGLLGPSQFVLRIPSLLAGLVFAVNAMRLANLFMPPSHTLAQLGFLALVLNPLTLDFLSVARGYSLALAILSCAVVESIRLVSDAEPRPRRFALLGVYLALSVCANLTFLYSSSALFLAVVILCRLERRMSLKLALRAALPAILIAGLILCLPLSHAVRGHFVFGQQTLRASVTGLIAQSLNHSPELPGAITGAPLGIAFCLASITLVAATLFAAFLPTKYDAASIPFMLCLISTDLILLFLVVARRVAGLAYPEGRTGLFLVFFFTLLCITLVSLASGARRRVWLITGTVAMLLLIARFVSQLSVSYYSPWRYDSSTRRIFETIQRRGATRPARKIRIACSWFYAPTLEFYRQTSYSPHIEPVVVSPPRLTGFDYYVLTTEDLRRPEAAGLITILHDDLSEATLAAPAP